MPGIAAGAARTVGAAMLMSIIVMSQPLARWLAIEPKRREMPFSFRHLPGTHVPMRLPEGGLFCVLQQPLPTACCSKRVAVCSPVGQPCRLGHPATEWAW